MSRIYQYILTGVFILNLFSLNAQQGKGFVLKGTISGIAEGIEVKLENANNNAVIATAKATKGTFTLTGTLPEPELHWLKIAGEVPQYIYLENSQIEVSGSKPVSKNFKVQGSASHNDFVVFQSYFNPLIVRIQSVVPQINSTPGGPQRDSLMGIYMSILDSVQLRIDEYVAKFPSSYVTPFILFVTTQFYDDPLLLDARFGKLNPVVQASMIGSSLKQYIDRNKIGAIGSMALDFTQPDTSGVPVSLNSFRGKYVLVDFWASWCGPCRMENPNVVENYHKFKNKNFTVFGVSLDRPGQKDKWIEAIHKDNLTWSHVSDLQFWNNAAAILYNVSGIPFNFLVDPDGKIIARNLRGPELTSKLCEVLGCD